MTEPRARSESLGDSTEDNPLTIRLPNPRSFLARQSQWKGRRGKPRCDHCRLNNLKVSPRLRNHLPSADVEKCDRVLPTCNHCSWANRECKYTPLPTPAHRGIPRCDRCRFHNLKVCGPPLHNTAFLMPRPIVRQEPASLQPLYRRRWSRMQLYSKEATQGANGQCPAYQRSNASSLRHQECIFFGL
jgi:hypothetical protein